MISGVFVCLVVCFCLCLFLFGLNLFGVGLCFWVGCVLGLDLYLFIWVFGGFWLVGFVGLFMYVVWIDWLSLGFGCLVLGFSWFGVGVGFWVCCFCDFWLLGIIWFAVLFVVWVWVFKCLVG